MLIQPPFYNFILPSINNLNGFIKLFSLQDKFSFFLYYLHFQIKKPEKKSWKRKKSSAKLNEIKEERKEKKKRSKNDITTPPNNQNTE